MEEADALCSRVGIMVKGELRFVYLLYDRGIAATKGHVSLQVFRLDSAFEKLVRRGLHVGNETKRRGPNTDVDIWRQIVGTKGFRDGHVPRRCPAGKFRGSSRFQCSTTKCSFSSKLFHAIRKR